MSRTIKMATPDYTRPKGLLPKPRAKLQRVDITFSQSHYLASLGICKKDHQIPSGASLVSKGKGLRTFLGKINKEQPQRLEDQRTLKSQEFSGKISRFISIVELLYVLCCFKLF